MNAIQILDSNYCLLDVDALFLISEDGRAGADVTGVGVAYFSHIDQIQNSIYFLATFARGTQ